MTTKLYQKNEVTFPYGTAELIIETGRLAKQADGAVLISSGATQVLVTVCSAREMAPEADFFPLLVDYKEKFYASGKFLGGFNKREGRPSNSEILLMRMIDRPLRPMFPEGYFHETIITAQVLSFDPNHDPEILAGLGASAALMVSDIPFQSPIGFARVAKVAGKLVLNPTPEELKKTEIDLIVSASEEAILMVEGESKEVSEKDMLEAILFAHNEIKVFCQKITAFQKQFGKVKRTFTPNAPKTAFISKVKDQFLGNIKESLAINDKLERSHEINKLKKIISETLEKNYANFGLEEKSKFSSEANKAVEDILYHTMRNEILVNKKRIGGRGVTEVRPIDVEVDILKKVHGSALFTRGETQVLGAVTLGGKEGEQLVDKISGVTFDKFYLHYAFLPFSVGEAKGYRGVGRREIGHGNLAERALKMMMPVDYSYCVRVNCEVLESNGSSSMGSVCAGSLALMDAGVPLREPVAGIAMGLVKEGNDYQILSDILGDEDHLGDMDFKVAGTSKGITAIQMDIKITGINADIMSKALDQAKIGRIHILKEMSSALEHSRNNYKKGVPLVATTKINVDQIGAFIGPGGKNIKGLQENFKVNIECLEDGTIKVFSAEPDVLTAVLNQINLQMNGPTIGDVFDAVVVSLKEYGAFVDIAGGLSGLVHVSEISNDRVSDVGQYLAEGDKLKVKVMEVDRFGKIRLSAKAVMPINKKS